MPGPIPASQRAPTERLAAAAEIRRATEAARCSAGRRRRRDGAGDGRWIALAHHLGREACRQVASE